MSVFTLTIIGSGSAMAMHGRHPSAQVVRYGDTSILIDCGEGTQDRLRQAGIKLFSIQTILISHLHGDHVFGLPGLLSSYAHLKRTTPLKIFGPPGIEGLLREVIRYTELHFAFPLTITELSSDLPAVIGEEDGLTVHSFPLQHRIPCRGYLLRENSRQIRLRKDVVEELQLPIELRKALLRGEGISFHGQHWQNSQLTRPAREPVGYAYCSDTRYDPKIASWLKEISVLYHETTFMEDLAEMAEITGHATAREAAQIAKAAGVNCLITGHYSSRYKDLAPLLEEARKVFPNVLPAEEGKVYDLRELAEESKK